MHEARVHDAIPARDREATGDSFTNRAITNHTRTAVYMNVVVPNYIINML
ncbi:MAG: hypothetical protein K5929_03965 [Lachnospiraceae bacterium]|nr:hypothetical protein [Lachnospiraceae bacterium]